jgi:putative ATPase
MDAHVSLATRSPRTGTASRPSAHRRLAKEHGYGRGYLFPHDFEGADVDQQYLPDELADRVYYEPSDEGLEKQIGDRLERLRRQRLERQRGKPR